MYVQGVDHVIPVDIYVPGCPPRPQMLIDAVVKLREQIKRTPINAKRAAEQAQRVVDLGARSPDAHRDMPSSVRRAGHGPWHKSFSPHARREGDQIRAEWIRAKERGEEKQLMLTKPDAQKRLAARERDAQPASQSQAGASS